MKKSGLTKKHLTLLQDITEIGDSIFQDRTQFDIWNWTPLPDQRTPMLMMRSEKECNEIKEMLLNMKHMLQIIGK